MIDINPGTLKQTAEVLSPAFKIALANKIDPSLTEIIREQPVALADFLRTARPVENSMTSF